MDVIGTMTFITLETHHLSDIKIMKFNEI